MRRWAPAAAVALLLAPSALAVWSVAAVAELGSRVKDLAVGDGDGDGDAEVYVATEDRRVRQLEWDGSVWNATTMATLPYVPLSILIGDVNGGGNEVYVGDDHGRIYRFEWNGTGQSRWNHVLLLTLNSPVNALAYGDGNGDGGEHEAYAGLDSGRVYRWAFSHGTWHELVSNIGFSIRSLAVGNGDDDADQEVYAGVEGYVVRLEAFADHWQRTYTTYAQGRHVGLVTGDLEGDGNVSVYTINQNRRVYRWSCCWTTEPIYTLPATPNDLAAGDLDGDGLTELYAALQNGHAYQLEFAPGGWSHAPLGSAGSGLKAIGVGDADQDGGAEVYAGSGLGRVVEYEP